MEQASHEGRSRPRRTLGEIVEEFEFAWNLDDDADVSAFLPPSDDPSFERVALELLRVDLERRWRIGQAKPVEEYVRQFPDVLRRSDLIEQLAYEEYRLLKEHGEPVNPLDYARRLNVATDHWPSNKVATDSTPLMVQGDSRPPRRDSLDQQWPGIGDRFLDFELIELLGRGELGEVYLARQPGLADRLVVLKITTEHWCESDRLARLRHQNVMPIHSVHQEGELQAACMPYFGRHTLLSVLKTIDDRTTATASDAVNVFAPADNVERFRAGSVPHPSHRQLDQLRSLSFENLCLWIVSRIAAGLTHAHERGILHRDLKPANILLTDDGQPMILDFNLSETMSSQRATVVGGTLPYMAPEHLRAIGVGSRIDARSDLYSLGVILFQMLTGQLPFSIQRGMDGPGLEAMIAERSVAPVRSSSLNPRVTPAIDEIVKKCLDPDPKQRYRTAEQLQQDLECQLAHQPLRHAANRSIKERANKWVRRHPRAAATLGVLTASLAVIAVISGLLLRSDSHVAQLQAHDQFKQFEWHAQQARPILFMLDQNELLDIALGHVDQALQLYDVSSEDWQQASSFRRLDEELQRQTRAIGRELSYLMASQDLRRSRRLTDQKDKTRILNRALNHNQIAMNMDGADDISPGVVRQQAAIQASLGHAEEAARLNQRAETLSDEQRLDQLLIVLEHIKAREHDEALKQLIKLDKRWPQDFTVWYLMGRIHYAAGEMPEAIACFVTCSKLLPDSATAYFQLGICHWRQQDYNAAEEAFNEACQRDPAEPVYLINRAMARMKQERLAEAIDDLTQAILLGRNDSLPYLLRYRTFKAAGDDTQAQKDLARGLQATPIEVRGFNMRGVERVRSGDLHGAMADFESALIIDPDSRRALQNLAYVLARLSRFEDAVATLDRILVVHPDNWGTRMNRVLLLASGGMRTQATADAEQLILDAEANLRDANELAEVYYYVACTFAQASTHAENALIADEDTRQALKWLGKAMEIDRRWADAAQVDADFRPATRHERFRSVIDAAQTLPDVVDRVAPPRNADQRPSAD